jgi:hypothetical protein
MRWIWKWALMGGEGEGKDIEKVRKKFIAPYVNG